MLGSKFAFLLQPPFILSVIYKSYLVPNDVMTDELFLRHLFSATLLEALGLRDESGVIYELINYRYSSYLGYSCFFRFFTDSDLGHWDLMIDGMINVSPSLTSRDQ